jgi:glycolate dehydrogenase FAD-linked subunit
VRYRIMTSTGQALAGLRDLDVTTDPDVLEAYRRDQAAISFLEPGMPAALIRPRTLGDVRDTLRVAAANGIPVVPRGAGSGLSGGANAVDGCLVLSLDRMTEVAIEPAAMVAVAQPGAITDSVKSAAAQHGLRYPPDPASSAFSTIGGNVATNAGGLCCVKHGVTRDFVLGLEAVMPGGEVLRAGGRARKDVVGYDLRSLLCGSEGTLAVVTEATLRLIPQTNGAATLAASFPDLADAGRAVAAIMRRFVPSLLELMDRASINAVEDLEPMDLDREAGAMVFARSDAGLSVADAMAELCEGLNASIVVTSDEQAEGRMLMAARRLAYPALERLGATLLDDVGVPLDQLAPLLAGIERIASERGVLIGTFGHAGDGNMHPTIVYDHRDADVTGRALLAFHDILSLALALGGTVTGEHGVGLLKRDAAALQLGSAHRLCLGVKALFDPRGILNPGKVL